MYNVHDLLYLYPQYHVTGWHVWYNIMSRAKQLRPVAMADKMGSVQVGQSILFLDMQARAKGISMGSLSVVAVRVSSILLAWVIGSQVVRVKPATSACNLKCLTATNTSAIVAVVMTTVTNTVNILFWDWVKRGLCSLLDCCSS